MPPRFFGVKDDLYAQNRDAVAPRRLWRSLGTFPAPEETLMFV
jgi:hypothetical protein